MHRANGEDWIRDGSFCCTKAGLCKRWCGAGGRRKGRWAQRGLTGEAAILEWMEGNERFWREDYGDRGRFPPEDPEDFEGETLLNPELLRGAAVPPMYRVPGGDPSSTIVMDRVCCAKWPCNIVTT